MLLSCSGLSGIWLTQVGDPLGHGEEGFVHRISSDSVVGGALLSVAEAEDQ